MFDRKLKLHDDFIFGLTESYYGDGCRTKYIEKMKFCWQEAFKLAHTSAKPSQNRQNQIMAYGQGQQQREFETEYSLGYLRRKGTTR